MGSHPADKTRIFTGLRQLERQMRGLRKMGSLKYGRAGQLAFGLLLTSLAMLILVHFMGRRLAYRV